MSPRWSAIQLAPVVVAGVVVVVPHAREGVLGEERPAASLGLGIEQLGQTEQDVQRLLDNLVFGHLTGSSQAVQVLGSVRRQSDASLYGGGGHLRSPLPAWSTQ